MPRKQRGRLNVGETNNLDNLERLRQAIGARLTNGPYSSEFAALSETVRDRLIDALAREVEFARVKVPGKREESKREEKRAAWGGEEPGAAWTRQAFMIGVTRALKGAGLPIKRWRDTKTLSDKEIYESRYFEITRGLAKFAEITLPHDLTHLAMQADNCSIEPVKHNYVRHGCKSIFDIYCIMYNRRMW
jgi:hypothetical protein